MTTPRIGIFALGDFATNCHLLRGEGARCWIVDAGDRPQPLLDAVAREGLSVEGIFLTHCHCDHVAGLDRLRRAWGPLPVLAHRAERGFCSDPSLNLSVHLGEPVVCEEPTVWLEGGELLDLAGVEFETIHLPGHSPGGLALLHAGSAQAIVGDTLFAGSIGRIDFPTSDPKAMERSLARLMELPDAVRIFPGHGPTTTIGAERRTNPYLRPGAAIG